MKIRMNTAAAGPSGGYAVGQVLEVGKDIEKAQAEAFLAGRYATPVVEREVEQAVVKADETRDYAALKVAELRDLCAARGIAVPEGAKKADIIGLLEGV